jgi:hypothetical protein
VDTDIYGPSKVVEPSKNSLVNGKPSKRTRTVIQLSLCDSLPAYGPIADMTFSLARNSVCLIPLLEKHVIYLVLLFIGSACTGTCCRNWWRSSQWIFTLFQVCLGVLLIHFVLSDFVSHSVIYLYARNENYMQ